MHEMGIKKFEEVFLFEKNNCIVISKKYDELPVCDVDVLPAGIQIDEHYCEARGLFNGKNERLHKVERIEEKAYCGFKIKTEFFQEYRIRYCVKDKALIIPLKPKQFQKKFRHYGAIKNNILFIPNFIASAMKIHDNTLLKLEVKNGKIFCRKCSESESITYHQTVTIDDIDIAFKEQIAKVSEVDIRIESFILKAAHMQSNDTAALRLTAKNEFVIEPWLMAE